jgi:hypothetical protein
MRNNGRLLEKPTSRLLKELDCFMVKIYNPYNADIFMDKHEDILKELLPDDWEKVKNSLKKCMEWIEGSIVSEITVSLSLGGCDGTVVFSMCDYTFRKSVPRNPLQIAKENMYEFFFLFICSTYPHDTIFSVHRFLQPSDVSNSRSNSDENKASRKERGIKLFDFVYQNTKRKVSFMESKMSSETKEYEKVSLDCTPHSKMRKVHINIGGKIFVTNNTTLAKSGYFSALLKDEEYGKDSENTPFIDRSDEMFSLVLDCLRSECRLLRTPTRQLLYELNYFLVDVYNPYHLEDFIKQCKEETELSSGTWKVIKESFEKTIDVLSWYEGMIFRELSFSNDESGVFFFTVDGRPYEFFLLSSKPSEKQEISHVVTEFIRRYIPAVLSYFGWKMDHRGVFRRK